MVNSGPKAKRKERMMFLQVKMYEKHMADAITT